MKLSSKTLMLTAAALYATTMLVDPTLAVAADSSAENWLDPMAKGANSLSEQLVNIGAPILGLCIAGYGGWAVMNGRVDWSRLWMFLLGGTFIGIGPNFASWFMGLLSGNGN